MYMNFVFVCPKCKGIFNSENESPFNGAECPTCNLSMHYMGVTLDTWNNLAQDEKNKIKETVLNDFSMPHTIYLNRLSNDMHSVKNILTFFLVIAIINGIIMGIIAVLN